VKILNRPPRKNKNEIDVTAELGLKTQIRFEQLKSYRMIKSTLNKECRIYRNNPEKGR